MAAPYSCGSPAGSADDSAVIKGAGPVMDQDHFRFRRQGASPRRTDSWRVAPPLTSNLTVLLACRQKVTEQAGAPVPVSAGTATTMVRRLHLQEAGNGQRQDRDAVQDQELLGQAAHARAAAGPPQ